MWFPASHYKMIALLILLIGSELFSPLNTRDGHQQVCQKAARMQWLDCTQQAVPSLTAPQPNEGKEERGERAGET